MRSRSVHLPASRRRADRRAQAFADEFAEARKRYVVERAEWERTVTPQRLRLLNAQRAKKGKSRVRVRKAPEDRKPITSFSRCAPPPPRRTRALMRPHRFLIEYRKNNTEEGKPSLVTSAAAKAWRGMADAEKQVRRMPRAYPCCSLTFACSCTWTRSTAIRRYGGRSRPRPPSRPHEGYRTMRFARAPTDQMHIIFIV
jgi:hypothetical protein